MCSGAVCKSFSVAYLGLSTVITTNARISKEGKIVSVNAKWDTGAVKTCITEKVVGALGLSPLYKKVYYGVFSEMETDVYQVDINFAGGILFENVEVVLVPSELRAEDVIVGMDIISQGDFVISNHGNGTVFSFRTPSPETISLPL